MSNLRKACIGALLGPVATIFGVIVGLIDPGSLNGDSLLQSQLMGALLAVAFFGE